MQVFSRDATEEEWQRFKRYASFVRQLQVVVQNQEVFIDESVWKALAVKSCGQPLFPYLEDLTDFKVEAASRVRLNSSSWHRPPSDVCT